MKGEIRPHSSFRSAFALALLLLAFLHLSSAKNAYGQATGTLKGTVADASGASVPKANVVVTNQANGAEWPTETDASGEYLVPSLPAGRYQVAVAVTGFQMTVVSGIILDPATTVTQNVVLQIGQVTQNVTVKAESPVIDSSTITIGEVVDQKTVQEIPLNGRHFTDLSFLTAGTVTPPSNGFLSQPIRGQGIFGLNTAGQREDTVNFMVNGVNLNDMVNNQITFQPSINTVSEFKFDNSVPSAEYGRNSGAVVNIATRSGTNGYHGEAFEFLRNSDMDARNFFNPVGVPQSTLKRNNFGAAFGGPIVKDKAHFFLSYEGLRHRQGLTVNTQVLTPAQRAQAQATGDAAVRALLPLIPVGTPGAGGYFFLGSSVAPVNIDQGTADVDVALTSSDRLHGYFAIQQDLRQEPLYPTVNDTLPGWGDVRASRRQIMTIGEDHIFSPTLTNAVRVGYNRIHITFTPKQQLDSATFNVDSGVPGALGLADINIGGTGALDFGGPQGDPAGRGDTTVVFGDTVSWLKGRHSLSFGTELRRFYNNNFSKDTSRFIFSNVAAFIADNPSSYQLLGFTDNRILSPTYDFFVEDSFKWRSNVTLQLGLRYDWYSTPSEADNRFVVFRPATVTLNQIGTGGLGQPFHTNNLNFQPRLGIVWDPFGNGGTVLRAAYGILTDEPITNVMTVLNANPPFATPLIATSGVKLINAASIAGKAGLAPSTIDPNFDNPYVQEWNLNIQQRLTNSIGLTVAYVGSEGTHLRVAENANQLKLVNGALVRPYPALSASSPIRPGSAIGNIIEAASPATASYNGLWLTLDKRFSKGLQFLTSYSYSKSIDIVSQSNNNVLLQNSLSLRDGRGLSDFDTRHHFVFSGFYELPFTGNRLVSGWQFGIISTAQTGNPLNVITSITGFTGTTGNGALRPDIVGPVTTGRTAVSPTVIQWFHGSSNLKVPCTDPTKPATCHFGDLRRNAFTGPGFTDTDFSLVKNTKITERVNLQFRAEFFDIFNQVNFGNPVLNIQSSTFGDITSTRFPNGDQGSSRQLQMALKLLF
jgi:hypothetical protein